MAGKSLQDLGLKPDVIEGGSYDSLPEQAGSFGPPPEPGTYRFQLPTNLAAIYDTVDSADYGQRIRAIFDKDLPLVIVQSPANAHNGEPFQTQFSNVPRPRGKDKILASDFDYVLRALGVTARPTTNQGYIQALMQHAGQTFTAEVEWSWSCRKDREMYVDDGQGGQTKIDGRLGCGARYYQGDVPKGADGKYPYRITCGTPDCGASLRAFPNLTRFRA